MGNIVGTGPEDIRGEVLACQASSKEEIESHLQAHPLSKVSAESEADCIRSRLICSDSHVAGCLGYEEHLNLAARYCAQHAV